MHIEPTLRERLAAVQRGLISPQVVYFPVRHHSPVCAWQIRTWIREFKPRAVLVEGPDDFQPLLPHLLHAECKPPVAIYTHFRLGGKTEASEDERHAAYYPLAAFSPEWVALREGDAVGAELHFIDLDYPSQHHAEREAGQNQALEIESLQAEQHFRRSNYLREVGRRLGCRDHDELWDHLIEIPGWKKSPEEVIRDVAAYCFFSRLDASEEVLAADGTSAREAAMATKIAEVLQVNDPRPVLVVTGGFHSIVLPDLVANPPAQPKRHRAAVRNACLARYTFAQLDSLSGYSAGMPNPGYYQSIWEALERGAENPLDSVALRFLVDLGHMARSRDLAGAVSVADEIEALAQAKRLSQFRGHMGAGREDLWDGIRGCLVKGEMGADGQSVLALARKLFTGTGTGSVPPDAGVSPLVEDFRRATKEQKLPSEFGGVQKVALEIYKKMQHRKTSRLLHRLCFLDAPYAERRAGPDFLNCTDLTRVIEHWDCSWTPQTETKLIEASVYGSSLEEAAQAKLGEAAQKLENESSACASKGVTLLIQACLMGLPGGSKLLAERLGEWISRDAAFVSVAQAFAQMVVLGQNQGPLEASKIAALPELVRIAYIRSCELLLAAPPTGEEVVGAVLEGCLLIHSRLALKDLAQPLDPELFWQSLKALLASHSPPILRGAATGLLHSAGHLEIEEVLRLVRGALAPALEEGAKQSDFLVGLLKTARELAWQEPRLLDAIELLLESWDDEEFLLRLPHLRLAWSDFTPRETDLVAGEVAKRHGVQKTALQVRSRHSEEEILEALGVYARVEQAFREDGLEEWLKE